MKKLILDRDDPTLRLIARPVLVSEIGSPKLKGVIALMKQALQAEEDGVAIAAPQVGESLRLFIIKGSTLALAKGEGVKGKKNPEDLVFINPEIVKVSKKRRKMEEGCLSIRWLYGQVARHEKVSMTAFNEGGKAVSVDASGLLAQIFQHEIDHLDGILFTDKAEDIRDLPPSEPNKE